MPRCTDSCGVLFPYRPRVFTDPSAPLSPVSISRKALRQPQCDESRTRRKQIRARGRPGSWRKCAWAAPCAHVTRLCCHAPALVAAALFASCAFRPANRPTDIATDHATGSAGASSAVELRFDWPVGLTGRVEHSSREVRESPAYNETLAVTSRCRLVVEAADANRFVRYEDCTATVVGDATPRRDVMCALYALGLAIDLPLLVSDRGAVVGVYGAADRARRIDAFLRTLSSHAPQQTRPILETFAPVFTEEHIAYAAQAQWSKIVGSWLGARLAAGRLYLADKDLPGAAPSIRPLREMLEVTVAGRKRCRRGGITRSCVRLEIVSYPEAGVLRDNAENVTQKLAPAVLGSAPADPIWLEMSIVERSELVTEPDTLIPHALESVRQMKGKIRLPDGTVMPLEETTTEARTYDYD